MNYYNYYENNILPRSDDRIDSVINFCRVRFPGKMIFTMDYEDTVKRFRNILSSNGIPFEEALSNSLIEEYCGEGVRWNHGLSPVIGYNEVVFFVDKNDFDYLSLFIQLITVDDINNEESILLCFVDD